MLCSTRTYMVQLRCTSGRRFGTTFLGPNVIFSYGWWLKTSASLGKIFAIMVFRDFLFVSFVHIVRNVPPTCSFFSLFLERYDIDGGRLGIIVVFMILP